MERELQVVTTLYKPITGLLTLSRHCAGTGCHLSRAWSEHQKSLENVSQQCT